MVFTMYCGLSSSTDRDMYNPGTVESGCLAHALIGTTAKECVPHGELHQIRKGGCYKGCPRPLKIAMTRHV